MFHVIALVCDMLIQFALSISFCISTGLCQCQYFTILFPSSSFRCLLYLSFIFLFSTEQCRMFEKKTRTGQMANNLLIQLFNWNLPRYNKYTDRCETGWESIQLFDWQNSRYSNCSNLNRSKKWCSSFSLNMNVLNRHTKKWLLRNGGSKSTAHVDNSMEHNLKNEESVQMLWKIQLFSLLKLLTIP